MREFVKIIWGMVVCVGLWNLLAPKKSLLASTKRYTCILANFYCPISPKHYNMG